MHLTDIKVKKRLNTILANHSVISSEDKKLRRSFLKELEMGQKCDWQDVDWGGSTSNFILTLKTHLEDQSPPRLKEFIQKFLEFEEDTLSTDEQVFLRSLSGDSSSCTLEDSKKSPARHMKPPDKAILIEFDLDEMRAEFQKQLSLESGPIAFSLQAPDTTVWMRYYAERFFQLLLDKRNKKNEDEEVKSWHVRLCENDIGNDYLLKRLREELDGPEGSIGNWFENHPDHDLVVFVRKEVSSGVSDGEMKEIAEAFWETVLADYAGLLEEQDQFFLVFWCNIGRFEKQPIKETTWPLIDAERFFALNSPSEFDMQQLKKHWRYRLKKSGLDEVNVQRFLRNLKDCGGEITATYGEMCDILNNILKKASGAYEYGS